MEFTIQEIADYLQGTVEGTATEKIYKLAKIEEGEQGSISFLANPKYTQYIYTSQASAIICNKTFQPEREIKPTLIRVDDAYSSFAKLLNLYANTNAKKKKKISRKAVIHRSATIGKQVSIAEFVSVAENVTIGEGTEIHANVTIYPNVKIGKNCKIYAGVNIINDCEIGNNCIILPGAIIGSDGFGFAPIEDGKYYKIPQTGNVILEDDVEIGANSTIDRATMGSTIIRKGTKVDNLIQIGHNCEIGSNTVIAGQTGISGSTKVGNNCMIGGQVGVAGHLKIGNNVKIAAKSGIHANIDDNDFHMGAPSFNAREYKRSYIHFARLDSLVQRINQLEKELEKLQEK